MTPSSTAKYVTKEGEERRYVRYVCPGYSARICSNGKSVPESWLRDTVVAKVRERLLTWFDRLPPNRGTEAIDIDWLESWESWSELFSLVRQSFEQLQENHIDQRPAWQQELAVIQAKIKGWSESLAKTDLDQNVRAAIETEFAAAVARQHEIEARLAEHQLLDRQTDSLLQPCDVLARLERLSEILASDNPTAANLELSLHIDCIECYSDGRVVMRTCKLGALAGVTDLMVENAQSNGRPATSDVAAGRATPRRRARLRVDDAGSGEDLQPLADRAADPYRSAGLDSRWFWEDEFTIPKSKSWAAQHAGEVAELRASGLTMEKLAVHFGKTVPTIRAALRHAAGDGLTENFPTRVPRRRWHEHHAAEVARLKSDGMSTMELAEHFGKSDTTIRKALRHANQMEIPMGSGKNE